MLGFGFNIFFRWVFKQLYSNVLSLPTVQVFMMWVSVPTVLPPCKWNSLFSSSPIISRGIFLCTLYNTASSSAPQTLSEDAGIELRTVATFFLTLAVRLSNRSTSGWDLPHHISQKEMRKMFGLTFFKLLIYNLPVGQRRSIESGQAPPPHRSARQAGAPPYPPPPRWGGGWGKVPVPFYAAPLLGPVTTRIRNRNYEKTKNLCNNLPR